MTQTVDEALFSILEGNAGVRSLVGAPPKIYPIKAPEGADPAYATFSRAGGQDVAATTGSSGLRSTVFDFECWGRKPSEALILANAIMAAFQAYPDFQKAGVSSGEIRLNSILFIGEGDDYDDVHKRFSVTYSFEVWYNLVP